MLLLLLACCGTVSLRAQCAKANSEPDDVVTSSPRTDFNGKSSSAGYALTRGTNEFGFWAGFSPAATTALGGLTKDQARNRQMVIAAFRYGRTFAANHSLAWQYTFDAVPIAVETDNIIQRTTVVGATETISDFDHATTYGAGLTPLGLQVDFRNSSSLKPFVHINGGFLIFAKPVPLPDAGKFAFTAEIETGVRIFTSQNRAISIGVGLHHISNGGRPPVNRGLNQLVIYAGFSVFK
jgi:Lipid A 3-O-deacylase (PagL)